ncbi:hypothetical protein PRIPAC_84304 [Pristionchus pacificus]|uniref:Uncharacterized protein n=1 Tax=Pristionchus pacificus TaxID=54126 RepID=A0A2A6BN93_PRIPA|nr:hypothetical protein PRIPAC_84304 [Pristionchus pacificus]|eukprot:PDM67231.1 hypothetical protein PRIPAC_48648 [Pristionchus pacificus]
MDHDLLCLLYAGFLATGGVIGYLKKGSLPSLLAAVGTGALVAFSTYFALPFQPTIVAVISGGLTVAMGNRYRKGGKFFPPGAIAIDRHCKWWNLHWSSSLHLKVPSSVVGNNRLVLENHYCFRTKCSSYGDTRKRWEDELERTRESSRFISKDDEFGGFSLHLTRLSCQERQFSWQVRTAIELEESLNPLILTAIEKEESIDDKTNEDESSDGKEEENEDEMHTALEWTQGYRVEDYDDEMLMETALEYIDGGSEINENMDGWSVKDDEEKIHSLAGIECENGEDKCEWMLSEEKNDLERWGQSVESNDGKLDETDGFGTGIVLISKGGNESRCASTSVISLSIDPSLQSVDLSTPAKEEKKMEKMKEELNEMKKKEEEQLRV